MNGERSLVDATVVDRAPRIPTATAPAPPGAAVPGRRLSRGWAIALGAGWPLVVVASMALEPAPADPNAPVPLVIEVATLAAFVALLATSVAAGVRHRAAAVIGVVSGLLLAPFVVACPVSGHHAVGLWWYAELTLVVGMLGVSLAALGPRASEGVPPRR